MSTLIYSTPHYSVMAAIFELNDANVLLLTDAGSSGGGETAEGGTDRRVGFSQAAIDGDAECQLRKIKSYPGAKQPPRIVDDDHGRASRHEFLRRESCPDDAAQCGERPHISLCQVLYNINSIFARVLSTTFIVTCHLRG